jgi:hypothetical protein
MLVHLVMHRSPEQIIKIYSNVEEYATYVMNLCPNVHSKITDTLYRYKNESYKNAID